MRKFLKDVQKITDIVIVGLALTLLIVWLSHGTTDRISDCLSYAIDINITCWIIKWLMSPEETNKNEKI